MYKNELYKQLRNNRVESIAKASKNYAYNDLKSNDTINLAGMGGFALGAIWADNNPCLETLLKVFYMFDEHGLFKDNLCFDPQHFIETVIIPNFNNEKNIQA